MSRVTPADVKVIIPTNLSDDAIRMWVTAANCIVSDNQDCINGSEETLSKIELYLSAHFLAMLNPAVGGVKTKEKAEQLETTYATSENISKIIDSTVYGQTANALSGGCLGDTNDTRTTLFSIGGC